MRRVILLLLIVVVAVGGVAVVLMMGGESTPLTQEEIDGTATAEAVAGQDGGGEGVAPITNLVPVVIAVQDLPRGLRLTPDTLQGAAPAVAVASWPADHVPGEVFSSVEEMENLLVRSDIPVGSPILRSELAQDALALGRVGSDAALLLDPDQVAISIPLDLTGVGSVAYGLQPGDYIDVILSFLFIDVDDQFQTRLPNTVSILTFDPETGAPMFSEPREGRPETDPVFFEGRTLLIGPIESQRPRLVTQRTVTRAKVIHVGYFPPDGKILGVRTPTPFEEVTEIPTAIPEGEEAAAQQQQPPPNPTETPTPFLPMIVTVGVAPQDALVVVWAVDAQIPITLALRPANDQGTVPTTAVSLQYLIDTYGVAQPPVLPFALEPGIFRLRSASDDIMEIFDAQLFGTDNTQQ